MATETPAAAKATKSSPEQAVSPAPRTCRRLATAGFARCVSRMDHVLDCRRSCASWRTAGAQPKSSDQRGGLRAQPHRLARPAILRSDLAVIHADDGHVAAVFLC